MRCRLASSKENESVAGIISSSSIPSTSGIGSDGVIGNILEEKRGEEGVGGNRGRAAAERDFLVGVRGGLTASELYDGSFLFKEGVLGVNGRAAEAARLDERVVDGIFVEDLRSPQKRLSAPPPKGLSRAYIRAPGRLEKHTTQLLTRRFYQYRTKSRLQSIY
jgi:hypothetical protein